MKKNAQKILAKLPLIIFVFLSLNSFGGEKDSIKITLPIPEKINSPNDLQLQITIQSLFKYKHLIIPKRVWCGGKDDWKADIYFTVEKRVDSSFKELHVRGDIDFPYDPNRKLFVLKPNETFSISFNLLGFYYFKKGLYRVKVFFRPSNFNPGFDEASTDWIYFDVLKDLSELDLINENN